jgi:membrane protein required for colicin V production
MLIQLNWLDYSCIGLIAFSAIIGYLRGLVREISSLTHWIVGLWCGFVFYDVMSEQLPDLIQPQEVRYVLGFFVIFGAILISVTLVSNLLSWIIRTTGLRGPDHTLGLCFGLLRGAMFVTLFVLLARSTALIEPQILESSILLPYLEPLESRLANFIPT